MVTLENLITSFGLPSKQFRYLFLQQCSGAPSGRSRRLPVIMRLADNETQASETKCAEACWTNYTRRVAHNLKVICD